MNIETKRLILRKFTPHDFDTFAKLIADPEVMYFSIAGPITDIEKARNFFQRILDRYTESPFGLLAITDKNDQRMVGFSGLIQQIVDGKSAIELSYRIFPSDWGQGFATEACLALCQFAFQQPDLNEIVSIIEPQNIRSVAVAKKVGMQCVKETEFHGKHVHIYQLKKIL